MQVPYVDRDLLNEEMFLGVPADVWDDANIKEVLAYLYSNKQLDLTERQKDLLRRLAEAFD